MTKYCIGIINAARFEMSRECLGDIDLLDDEDAKCGQKAPAAPQHASQKSSLGYRRQIRLKLATKLLIFW
jgi:hypothetical protein